LLALFDWRRLGIFLAGSHQRWAEFKEAQSMKIAALALHANHNWPELGTDALAPGLNVIFGPSASGKTTVADLVTHALYGRRFITASAADAIATPQGEIVVENRGRQFRLRRSHDDSAGERLTVAALDHSAVDEDTVRQLVACLSPSLLRPLCAVSFRESPRLEWLLSPEFSHEFRSALWRLKWAPPTVQAELRPLYARLRALETEVATLVRGLGSEKSQGTIAAKTPVHTRNRRASHFLAQLTDGELVRLQLGDATGEAQVVTRVGDLLAVDALWSTQRDQVYLSLCLALVSALARHGARLPLVLDEPFVRMDARSAAALVDVLHGFAARRQQVLVFTAEREAAERCASLGANVIDMPSLQGERVAEAKPQAADVATRRARRRVKSTRMKHREAG
jgi:recombinational DNA repair ATPase RecF